MTKSPYFVSVTRMSCVLSQTMEYTGRIVAISEPNSPTLVAMKYRKFGDSPELRQLIRDVIRLECRPYPSMQPPPLGYFLKMIPPGFLLLPLLRQIIIIIIIIIISGREKTYSGAEQSKILYGKNVT